MRRGKISRVKGWVSQDEIRKWSLTKCMPALTQFVTDDENFKGQTESIRASFVTPLLHPEAKLSDAAKLLHCNFT